MEFIKKTILQSLTTGKTSTTKPTEFVIIPDLDAKYHFKIGLVSDVKDIGFFDAYEIPNTTTTTNSIPEHTTTTTNSPINPSTTTTTISPINPSSTTTLSVNPNTTTTTTIGGVNTLFIFIPL